jgi:hypothetical protein
MRARQQRPRINSQTAQANPEAIETVPSLEPARGSARTDVDPNADRGLVGESRAQEDPRQPMLPLNIGNAAIDGDGIVQRYE